MGMGLGLGLGQEPVLVGVYRRNVFADRAAH